MEFVAVQGMTLQDTSGTPGSPVITVTSSPSTKVNAGGSGVYFGGIDVSIASGSVDGAGCVLSSAATGTIPPSSQKMPNGSGDLANRTGDSVTITGAGTQNNNPCTASFDIEIVDPGQQKARGN